MNINFNDFLIGGLFILIILSVGVILDEKISMRPFQKKTRDKNSHNKASNK